MTEECNKIENDWFAEIGKHEDISMNIYNSQILKLRKDAPKLL